MVTLIFAQYCPLITLFTCELNVCLTVISLRARLIVFSCALIVVGAIFYFCGDSLAADLFGSRSVISGIYLVVFGIFLAVAGFMVLVSQVFRGRSIVF